MCKNDVIISDFSSAVLEKERLSPSSSPDRWETVGYRTKDVSGSFIYAAETCLPPPLTVNPGLKGWHRIYVCMSDCGGAFSSDINLRLSGDRFSRSMRAGSMGRYVIWSLTEMLEESFWKCADMTGQTVEISKTDSGKPSKANLFWLRFAPMTDEEIKAHLSRRPNKTMLAHMDGDFHHLDAASSPDDYCKQLAALADSDVGVVSQEIMNDLVDYSSPGYGDFYPRDSFTKTRAAYFKKLSENRAEAYSAQTAFARDHGMKLLAAQRMSLSNFTFPYLNPFFEVPFVNQHPEFMCAARDGATVGFMSYAYPEVRRFVIGTLLDALNHGFDGVELLFTRGVCLMFENPVAAEYRKRYPDGPDYRRLPASDPRLYEIRCGIMTVFFRELRSALDGFAAENGRDRPLVYVTGYYSAEASRQNGLDFETLASEGLIDGIVQSNMTVFETADDALDDDGLVDIEKYAKIAETGFVIRRAHGNDPDLTAKEAGVYRGIADRHHIQLYSELQWESSVPPEEYVKAARKIYAAGGMNIALWDAVPSRVQCLSEWNAVSRLGSRESAMEAPDQAEAYQTPVNLLAVGGQDIRYVSPNWRG